MEAGAPVDVELGAGTGEGEWAEGQRQLGADLGGARGAAVGAVEGAARWRYGGVQLIEAQAEGAAQPRPPLGSGLAVRADARLGESVFADGVGAYPFQGLEQPDARQVVTAKAQAQRHIGVPPTGAEVPAVRHRAADDRAPVFLLVLAVLHARGRRVQVQPVADQVGVGARGAAADAGAVGVTVAAAHPVAGEAVAVRPATIGGRERAVATDLAACDGALRHMLGRDPARAVAHRGDREAVARRSVTHAYGRVDLVQVFRLLPRAVGATEFDRPE